MELTNYLIQILVSIGIFLILCFQAEYFKKMIRKYIHKVMDPHEYFPKEEILAFRQAHYLILILFIYITIINFCFGKYFEISRGMFIFNSMADIIISLIIIMVFYRCRTKSRILSLMLMPLPSIASLVFGGTQLGFWNFLRIPALLYVVVISYHKFLDFSEKNEVGKMILLLLSIIFFCLILTIIFENQNPMNSLAMVTNAITSNGYAVPTDSTGGVLTSTFLAWTGYVLSGVGTATLAAGIIHRQSKMKLKKLEDKLDNMEKLLIQYQEENEKREH